MSTPERDRQLAGQIRHGYRKAAGLDYLVEGWMRSTEARRLRQHARLVPALASVLSATELDRISVISVRGGAVTLAVADSILLAELRNHRYQALVGALLSAGTGIGRVQFRAKRAE